MRSKNLSFNVPDNWNLFLAGDTQWGNVGTYENGFYQLCDMVFSEYRGCNYNRVAWMGDTIDCITVEDKRFTIGETKITQIRQQRDHALSKLCHLKDLILVGLKGNHEQKILNAYGDISDEIMSVINAAYGGYVCVPQFVGSNGKVQFRAFLHHGFGKITSQAKDYIQAQANKEASLKNKLASLYSGAAIMAMGHTHQLMVVRPDPSLQLVTDLTGEIHQVYRDKFARHEFDYSAQIVPEQYRWYVNTGSFLRLYNEGVDGYAERGGLKPVEMGFVVVCIRNGRIQQIYKETV